VLPNHGEATCTSEEDIEDENLSERVFYNLSAQFLWIGERTGHFDEAHVEFFRGIKNPIGYKCGPSKSPEDILKISRVLNPDNIMGKLVLIVRMGEQVDALLPPIIKVVKEN
jgi:3-deoxy-7-phosphoheptulonate synthase